MSGEVTLLWPRKQGHNNVAGTFSYLRGPSTQQHRTASKNTLENNSQSQSQNVKLEYQRIPPTLQKEPWTQLRKSPHVALPTSPVIVNQHSLILIQGLLLVGTASQGPWGPFPRIMKLGAKGNYKPNWPLKISEWCIMVTWTQEKFKLSFQWALETRTQFLGSNDRLIFGITFC